MLKMKSLLLPMSVAVLVAACGADSESATNDPAPSSPPVLPSASNAVPAPVSLVSDVGSTLTTPDGVSVTLETVAVNGAPGAESWEPAQEEEPADLPQGAVWPIEGYRVALTSKVVNNSSENWSIPVDFVALEVSPSDAEGFKILCTPVSVANAPDEQPGVAVGATLESVSRFVCPGQRADEPFEAVFTVPPASTKLAFAGRLPYQSTSDATAGQQ